jgi:hypothetical protein
LGVAQKALNPKSVHDTPDYYRAHAEHIDIWQHMLDEVQRLREQKNV